MLGGASQVTVQNETKPPKLWQVCPFGQLDAVDWLQDCPIPALSTGAKWAPGHEAGEPVVPVAPLEVALAVPVPDAVLKRVLSWVESPPGVHAMSIPRTGPIRRSGTGSVARFSEIIFSQ